MLDPAIYHAAVEFFTRLRDARTMTDVNIAAGVALDNLETVARAELQCLGARDLGASRLGDDVDRLLQPAESLEDLSARLVMPENGLGAV